jgi:hypothetical protein
LFSSNNEVLYGGKANEIIQITRKNLLPEWCRRDFDNPPASRADVQERVEPRFKYIY